MTRILEALQLDELQQDFSQINLRHVGALLAVQTGDAAQILGGQKLYVQEAVKWFVLMIKGRVVVNPGLEVAEQKWLLCIQFPNSGLQFLDILFSEKS